MPVLKFRQQTEQASGSDLRADGHNPRPHTKATHERQSVARKHSQASSAPVVKNPDKRLENILKGGQNAPLPLPGSPDETPRLEMNDRFDWKIRRPNFRKSIKAAQNLHKILSVVVDIGLLFLILVLMLSISDVKNILNNVINEMYQSFTIMDQSTISTSILIENAPIPISFSLPVVQGETNVILTQPVAISGAHVTINSGAFLISNAPATVTLPAGTVLPVSLDMEVPVQTTLLVNIDVPVEISLAKADPLPPEIGLHQAFIRLQNALGPYYCLFQQESPGPGDPNCQNGVYLVKK